MNYRAIRRELFQIRQAFRTYHQGIRYLNNRFVLGTRILRYHGAREKSESAPDLSMHVMLGHAHVAMALWSLGSFYAVSECIGKLYIHSDGTLTERDMNVLVRFFPHAEIVDPADVLIRYHDAFARVPRIKAFRLAHKDNFFLTKLIDPLIISDHPLRLIFDIDVLWFKNPEIIQRAVNAGCPTSFMMTAKYQGRGDDAYTNRVYFKDGTQLPAAYATYNGGIMLYHRKNLPAHLVADYLERLDMTRPESKHWVEQTGYAFGLQQLEAFPPDTYTIKGKVDDTVVARHYTGPRRVELYTEGLPIVRQLLCPVIQHPG